MEFLGRLGAQIAVMALSFGVFLAVAWVGHMVSEKTNRRWVAWLIGMAALVALIAIFGPTIDALDKVRCKGVKHYKECIDGDYENPY